MNYYFIAASVILAISLLVHTIPGNQKYKLLNPQKHRLHENLFEIWLTGRSGFQMVTIDLLLSMIFILLMGINAIPYNYHLALFISLLYLGYAIFWLLTLCVSKAKPYHYIRICHWCVFLVIFLLIVAGMHFNN